MLLFSQLFHWLILFYVIFQHIAVRTKYRCKIEGASNFNFRVTLFLRLSWTDVVLKLSIYHDCGFQWPLNNTIITFSVQYIFCRHIFIVFRTFVLPSSPPSKKAKIRCKWNIWSFQIFQIMFLNLFFAVCTFVFRTVFVSHYNKPRINNKKTKRYRKIYIVFWFNK